MPFSTIRNGLLRALPSEILALMTPNLRPVVLSVRKNIIIPGKPIEAAYFVEFWMDLDGLYAR